MMNRAMAMNSHRPPYKRSPSSDKTPDLCINNIGLSAGTHHHSHHQILFGIQGETQCAFDHTENIIDLTRCCAVPAGQRHAYEGRHSNSDILVINIDTAGRLAALLSGTTENSVLDRLFDREQFIATDLQLAQQVQALAQTLLVPTPNHLLQVHQMTGLLLTLENILCADHKTAADRRKIAVHQLNQLIDAHLRLPLSVAKMAYHLRISESHFYAQFLKEFGESPHQYALNRRLTWAKTMMLQGSVKLTDIAYEVGFSSSKKKKKWTGT